MTRQRKSLLKLTRANIVGIVDSPSGLVHASKLDEAVLDVIEVRLDAFDAAPDLSSLRKPIIATARSPKEGGRNELNARERISRYLAVLGHVDAIDIELAFRVEMAPAIEAARKAGRFVILSAHDFAGTPKSLRAMQKRAAAAGADVFKVATTPGSPADLAALLDLLDEPPLPTSVMGMGAMGKASRLAAIACGSVLNYGWIERPNVTGQWSAAELRKLSS